MIEVTLRRGVGAEVTLGDLSITSWGEDEAGRIELQLTSPDGTGPYIEMRLDLSDAMKIGAEALRGVAARLEALSP